MFSGAGFVGEERSAAIVKLKRKNDERSSIEEEYIVRVDRARVIQGS